MASTLLEYRKSFFDDFFIRPFSHDREKRGEDPLHLVWAYLTPRDRTVEIDLLVHWRGYGLFVNAPVFGDPELPLHIDAFSGWDLDNLKWQMRYWMYEFSTRCELDHWKAQSGPFLKGEDSSRYPHLPVEG